MSFREKYRPYIRWGITILLVVVSSFLCFFFMLRFDAFKQAVRRLTDIMAPINAGLIVAYLLNPLTAWLERVFMRLSRRPANAQRRQGLHVWCVVLSILLLLAIIVFLIGMLLPQVIDSISTLISNLDVYQSSIETWSGPFLDDLPQTLESTIRAYGERAEEWFKSFLQNDLLNVLGSVTAGVVEIGMFIYNFVMGLIVALYVLCAQDKILGRSKKLLYAFLKPQRANQVLGIARQTNRMFKGFLIGKILDSTIIGILCFLGMTIMHMPYTLLISVIVGVTNVIPYFGPFIGAIPSALLILMIDPGKCLIFVIFILVLQQIDGNVIGPKVLGNTTGLSSLGVLFSILIGGGLFGLVGMMVSVPIVGVVYALVKRVTDHRLKTRDLPVDTPQYVNMDGVDPETMIPAYLDKQQ